MHDASELTSGAAAQGWTLSCALCERRHPDDHRTRCDHCAGPVLKSRTQASELYRTRPELSGIWRYVDMLPLEEANAGISLGESGTPLLAAPGLARQAGVAEVHLKLDSLCPTGSFKDRAVAAGVDQAVSSGAAGIICASSGNAAASAAAYAARAGMPAILVMPEKTPPGKLAASAVYGAVQVLVAGDYSNSFAVAEQLSDDLGLANVTTTYINPHAVAGLRSVAYDLYDQLGAAPDAVIVPTSTGPLLHGVATGFDDLVDLGRATRTPRMIAAQPSGCSPIARAFSTGRDTVEAWEAVATTVSGLDDPLRGYAGDGTVTLREVRRTEGTAVALDDDDVEAARDLLRFDAGVFVEPAGAISVAALLELGRSGHLSTEQSVVCLLTGHGMKRMPSDPVEPIIAADAADASRQLAARGIGEGR